MDLYCTRCAEPWDNDTFHDVADERGITYQQAVADFRKRGCVAVYGDRCELTGGLRAEASALMFDLLGDDTDGVAAMMDDFGYLGLLD